MQNNVSFSQKIKSIPGVIGKFLKISFFAIVERGYQIGPEFSYFLIFSTLIYVYLFPLFREISLLRGLKQANIVTLHDIVHTKTSITLVFEYLDCDLKHYMETVRYVAIKLSKK